jgi:hypothetical protein
MPHPSHPPLPDSLLFSEVCMYEAHYAVLVYTNMGIYWSIQTHLVLSPLILQSKGKEEE